MSHDSQNFSHRWSDYRETCRLSEILMHADAANPGKSFAGRGPRMVRPQIRIMKEVMSGQPIILAEPKVPNQRLPRLPRPPDFAQTAAKPNEYLPNDTTHGEQVSRNGCKRQIREKAPDLFGNDDWELKRMFR